MFCYSAPERRPVLTTGGMQEETIIPSQLNVVVQSNLSCFEGGTSGRREVRGISDAENTRYGKAAGRGVDICLRVLLYGKAAQCIQGEFAEFLVVDCL